MYEKSSKSSLFLLEMIISICFFAVASAVCVQLFAKAHSVNTQSKELNMGIMKTEEAAELLTNGRGDTGPFLNYYPNSEELSGIIYVYFDHTWENCDSKGAAYQMEVRLTQKDSMETALLNTTESESGNSIYSMEVNYHIPHTLE